MEFKYKNPYSIIISIESIVKINENLRISRKLNKKLLIRYWIDIKIRTLKVWS
jgi:hypothetical protein